MELRDLMKRVEESRVRVLEDMDGWNLTVSLKVLQRKRPICRKEIIGLIRCSGILQYRPN